MPSTPISSDGPSADDECWLQARLHTAGDKAATRLADADETLGQAQGMDGDAQPDSN